MALWGLENLVWGNISGAFTTGQLTLNMATGHTARFTQFPARAVIWKESYESPDKAFWDGFAEIVTLISKSGDTFNAILRGQEGTAAISSDGSEVYLIAVVLTRGQLDKIMRAPPDASGPFDAILAGTPGAVTDAMARFVKDDGVTDAIVSMQGSPNTGDKSSLWLGDTGNPDDVMFELQRSAAVENRLSVIMNAWPFLTMEGRNRIGIGKAAPTFADGVNFGLPVDFDKLFGIGEVQHEIAAGVIAGVETNFVRIEAEGGVGGADQLDTLTLSAGFSPPGTRVILFLEADSTSTITVKHNAGTPGGIKLKGGTDYVLFPSGWMLAIISTGASNDNWMEFARFPSPENLVVLVDLKADSVAGGTFTSGAWRTRDLNSKLKDSDGLCVLGANQFILQPGTWTIRASAPAGNGVGRHQIRLWNVTDGVRVDRGSSEAQGGSTCTRSFLDGSFTISAPKTFEIQHQCTTTVATSGFGLAGMFGDFEIYTQVVLRRHV
jgi:hypothetical protein